MWATIKTITYFTPAAKSSIRGMNAANPGPAVRASAKYVPKSSVTPNDSQVPASKQDEFNKQQGSFGGLKVAKSALPSRDENDGNSLRASMGNSARQAGPSSPSKGSIRGIASSSKKGPRRSMEPIEALGRAITRILRHQAVELNLPIRPDGYVSVHDLLSLGIKTQAGIPLREHSVLDLKLAVLEDNKQRFSLLEDDGKLLIRANQGHSIKAVKSGDLLQAILSADEVPVCVHGTYKKSLRSILDNGLSRMQHNHVHFASGLPNEGGVISGMRSSCEALVYLDVERALADGMKLYMSDNKVILTEGFNGTVPAKYFVKVLEWPSRKQLYPSKWIELIKD